MTDIFNQPEANFPSENQSSNSYANQNSGLGGSGTHALFKPIINHLQLQLLLP